MMYNIYTNGEKLEVICKLILESKDLDLNKTYIYNELDESNYDNILTYILQERIKHIASSGVDVYKVDENGLESIYTLEQEYVEHLLFESRCKSTDKKKMR